MMMSKEEIWAGMTAILGDDPELLNDIYQDYLVAAENVFREAQTAELAGDFNEMRRAAHTLKGCSANVGAEVLRAQALAWEMAARNADINAYRELGAELRKAFAALGVAVNP